jgi:hypothetical protein
MVAFIASVVITGLMCLVAFLVARRRPPGKPLSWGEGFLAGTFVFALLLMMYGIVPNQWLLLGEKELGWRKDAFGIPNPFGKAWFEKGVTIPFSGGRGRIMISKEAFRDFIVTLMYGFFFVGQIMAWLWWQRRGKRPAEPAPEKSAFGRPLIRKA